MWLSSPSRERPLPWYFLNMEMTHFPTLVTPCVALLSYSLSPWQAGMQTARWGPKWESSLFIVREMGLANCRRVRREIMGLWSLSTRHPAGKMQGLASAFVGAWAPLGLSTFHQARALLSPSPPALAHLRNLAKVSDVIFNLLQAGLQSHMRDGKGEPCLVSTPAPWPMSRELNYTPLPATPKGVQECLSPAIAFWKMCLARQLADFGRRIGSVIN